MYVCIASGKMTNRICCVSEVVYVGATVDERLGLPSFPPFS